MKLEKLAVKKEPKKKHSYLVEVGSEVGFASSLVGVQDLIEEISKPGQTALVFKVEYNFVQSYRVARSPKEDKCV